VDKLKKFEGDLPKSWLKQPVQSKDNQGGVHASEEVSIIEQPITDQLDIVNSDNDILLNLDTLFDDGERREELSEDLAQPQRLEFRSDVGVTSGSTVGENILEDFHKVGSGDVHGNQISQGNLSSSDNIRLESLADVRHGIESNESNTDSGESVNSDRPVSMETLDIQFDCIPESEVVEDIGTEVLDMSCDAEEIAYPDIEVVSKPKINEQTTILNRPVRERKRPKKLEDYSIAVLKDISVQDDPTIPVTNIPNKDPVTSNTNFEKQ
jgi:hypothetical protein